jgi:cell division septum initiation protein DivIVA
LDRKSIEKSDFPISRRGYEPAAVDAHLKALADHFEELVRAVPTEPLASEASARVREIVAAAESSAAEIRRAAEQQASESAQRAAAEAESVRGEATRRAEECVAKVREATSLMLEHLEAMESELETLVGGLRSTGESQRAPAAAGRAAPDADREVPAVAEAAPPAPAPAGGQHAEPTSGADREAPVDPAGKGDEEKARVIALEMALSGKSREEADGYLAGEFTLDDRAKLLDEIYARVGEIER